MSTSLHVFSFYLCRLSHHLMTIKEIVPLSYEDFRRKKGRKQERRAKGQLHLCCQINIQGSCWDHALCSVHCPTLFFFLIPTSRRAIQSQKDTRFTRQSTVSPSLSLPLSLCLCFTTKQFEFGSHCSPRLFYLVWYFDFRD